MIDPTERDTDPAGRGVFAFLTGWTGAAFERLKSIGGGLIIAAGAKGASAAAQVTSTAAGADHQGLDVVIVGGGAFPPALGPTTPAASLSTVQAVSSALVTGQHAVTASVSQLTSTASYKNGIKLTNLSTSASSLFYGPSGVSATTGDELPAGQSVVLPIADPSLIYLITASGTATATFAGLS